MEAVGNLTSTADDASSCWACEAEEAGQRILAHRLADLDATAQHKRFLEATKGEQEMEVTARVNKLAFYEQSLQQQQLEAQELSHDLDEVRQGIRESQGTACRDGD